MPCHVSPIPAARRHHGRRRLAEPSSASVSCVSPSSGQWPNGPSWPGNAPRSGTSSGVLTAVDHSPIPSLTGPECRRQSAIGRASPGRRRADPALGMLGGPPRRDAVWARRQLSATRCLASWLDRCHDHADLRTWGRRPVRQSARTSPLTCRAQVTRAGRPVIGVAASSGGRAAQPLVRRRRCRRKARPEVMGPCACRRGVCCGDAAGEQRGRVVFGRPGGGLLPGRPGAAMTAAAVSAAAAC